VMRRGAKRRPPVGGPAAQTFFHRFFVHIDIGGEAETKHSVGGAARPVRSHSDALHHNGGQAGPAWDGVHEGADVRRYSAASFMAALVLLSVFSTLFLVVDEVGLVVRAAPPASGSFATPIRINDNTLFDQSLPVVVGLPQKNFLVAWQDQRSGTEDLYVSVSRDNGTTFGPNVRVNDVTGPSRQIEPAVAVSENGTVLLAWQDNRRGTFDYDIFFAQSYDGGVTFTRNLKVDDSNNTTSWQERPSIAVTDTGTIYVVWTDDRTGFLRERGAFSTDGGATFSPSKEISSSNVTSGQTGGVVVASGNRIYAAFVDNITGRPHPYICVSTNGGLSFNAPTRLDNTGESGALQRGVSIAPVPGGGIAAAWEDCRNGNWDIYGSVAGKDGRIRISDFRVDDDTTNAFQRGPCIAADEIGNLYVTWEDERDLIGEIRFSHTEPGSSEFVESLEVSVHGDNDLQRRASVIVTDPGQVFVVWQDDSAGTYDIYFASGYFPDLFGLRLVKGWNLVSIYLVDSGYMASTLGLMYGDVVVGWNSTTAAYDQAYYVGISPPSSDFAIMENFGYWIYAGVNESLKLHGTVPTLTQQREIFVPMSGGWAVVGFETIHATMHASDIPDKFDVPGAVKAVGYYDPLTGTSATYYTGYPSTDFKLVPGLAYWCWCGDSGLLTYDP